MASRTLAGSLALKGDWALGEDNWKDDMDGNLLLLSVLCQGNFAGYLAAEPGAPAQGTVVVLNAAHATHPNTVAVYDEAAWHYFTPQNGWRLYNTVTAAFWAFTAGAWATTVASNYYHYGSFAADAIQASEVLMDHIAATAHTLADDFADNIASVGTNPAANWVATIQVNGATVGTLTISAAGVKTWATTGTTIAVARGDVVTLLAPAAADAAIKRLRFTFKGLM